MVDKQEITNSILNSVKASLPVPVEVKDFDITIISDINAAFFVLNQLGVGPKEGFVISGEEDTYDDFTSNLVDQTLVKQYLSDKVKIVFDPPSSATLMETLKSRINENEFRLLVAWDKKEVRR